MVSKTRYTKVQKSKYLHPTYTFKEKPSFKNFCTNSLLQVSHFCQHTSNKTFWYWEKKMRCWLFFLMKAAGCWISGGLSFSLLFLQIDAKNASCGIRSFRIYILKKWTINEWIILQIPDIGTLRSQFQKCTKDRKLKKAWNYER